MRYPIALGALLLNLAIAQINIQPVPTPNIPQIQPILPPANSIVAVAAQDNLPTTSSLSKASSTSSTSAASSSMITTSIISPSIITLIIPANSTFTIPPITRDTRTATSSSAVGTPTAPIQAGDAGSVKVSFKWVTLALGGIAGAFAFA